MDASAEKLKRPRRTRRSRAEVTARIREAARQLFAERGYAATTTKEIARIADVSETLLFRYYGEKAALFDAVISAPFKTLMDAFAARNAGRLAEPAQEAEFREMIADLFHLVETNRDMFAAVIAAPPGAEISTLPHGLEDYFKKAIMLLEMRFAAAGKRPLYDIRVAASLAFGMIASGVLLRDLLSPLSGVSSKEITSVLSELILYAFDPNGPRNLPR